MKIKKEFIAVWTTEEVIAQTDKMPISRASYFHHPKPGITKIVMPEVSYETLEIFNGFRTKVTIEILPW